MIKIILGASGGCVITTICVVVMIVSCSSVKTIITVISLLNNKTNCVEMSNSKNDGRPRQRCGMNLTKRMGLFQSEQL